MKLFVLNFASIFLQVKNKEKYFGASETHQKGPTNLKGSLFEPSTLKTVVDLRGRQDNL